MCCLFCLAIVASEMIMSVCGYWRENEDNADDILTSLSPTHTEKEREWEKKKPLVRTATVHLCPSQRTEEREGLYQRLYLPDLFYRSITLFTPSTTSVQAASFSSLFAVPRSFLRATLVIDRTRNARHPPVSLDCINSVPIPCLPFYFLLRGILATRRSPADCIIDIYKRR